MTGIFAVGDGNGQAVRARLDAQIRVPDRNESAVDVDRVDVRFVPGDDGIRQLGLRFRIAVGGVQLDDGHVGVGGHQHGRVVLVAREYRRTIVHVQDGDAHFGEYVGRPPRVALVDHPDVERDVGRRLVIQQRGGPDGA